MAVVRSLLPTGALCLLLCACAAAPLPAPAPPAPPPPPASLVRICEGGPRPAELVLVGPATVLFFNDTRDRLVTVELEDEASPNPGGEVGPPREPARPFAPGDAQVLSLPADRTLRYRVHGLGETARPGVISVGPPGLRRGGESP